jgi:hypothetical protein
MKIGIYHNCQIHKNWYTIDFTNGTPLLLLGEKHKEPIKFCPFCGKNLEKELEEIKEKNK